MTRPTVFEVLTTLACCPTRQAVEVLCELVVKDPRFSDEEYRQVAECAAAKLGEGT